MKEFPGLQEVRIRRADADWDEIDEIWFCPDCHILIEPAGMLTRFGKPYGRCPQCGRLFVFYLETGLIHPGNAVY